MRSLRAWVVLGAIVALGAAGPAPAGSVPAGSVPAGSVPAGSVPAGSAPAAARVRHHWVPPAHLTWYWQLQGRVRLKAVDMSDVDAFTTPAASVRRLHADHQHVVCYVDAGTWEQFRPDAGRFPRSLLGRGNGWPGERWLDIRALRTLAPIIGARLDMCARKGFDGVEFDNVDGYSNATGFPLTGREQLRFDEWLAGAAHARGLAAFQKNDPEQAPFLQPYFDGVLDEQCNQYAECGAFASYLRVGKPVLDAEYRGSLYPGFCSADRRRGIMGALYGLALDGRVYRTCW